MISRTTRLTGAIKQLSIWTGKTSWAGAGWAINKVCAAWYTGHIIVSELVAGTTAQAGVVVEQIAGTALRTYSSCWVAYSTVQSTRVTGLVDRDTHVTNQDTLTVLQRIIWDACLTERQLCASSTSGGAWWAQLIAAVAVCAIGADRVADPSQ